MRVQISVTLEVDPTAWREAFGTSGSLRDDIRSYFLTQLQESYPVSTPGIAEVVREVR
jgi:hypothetical protein